MYGKWFLFTSGFGLLALFVIGLIATAYAPIFAVAIALLVGAFLLAGMATGRRPARARAKPAARIERP